MKIAYSNMPPQVRSEIEKESQHHVEKLKRLLKKYSPDLIVLHGVLDKTPRKSEFELSLNLTLPTGTLHSSGAAPDPRGCAKIAFAEIEAQLKKHQQKLRKDYMWKRKRSSGALKAYEVPSAD